MKPLGSSLKAHKAASRAWTRSSVKRRPAVRVPAAVMTGAVMAVIAAAPSAGSWLIFWTSSRRRLAVKPACRSAGRFDSPLPMPKSPGSLMTVSVRSALPSLWYCLILDFLYWMRTVGVTLSVMTRVRNSLGVGRLRPLWMRRPKIKLTLSGRPMSRLSRIICSRKIRPVTGRSSIWVKLNSACTMEMS